ncbi:MAG TPA: molybdopterin oxidoreductase [Desulfosporosinus sp.]|nr:molybdopterin oxidoreductase [Desulfosporosinus sp.]
MQKRLYYILLLILTGIGFWFIGQRLMNGMLVTNLTSSFSWGLWVVFYIFFIGLSAGSFLLSTMIYVFKMHALEKIGRLSLLSALFSLVGGLMFVLIDLGHPERFWYTLVHRNFTSVLEWEIHFYLLYIMLVLGELWLVMRDDLSLMATNETGMRGKLGRIFSMGYRTVANPEGRVKQSQFAGRWVRILGILGVPMAIAVHGGTGSIFAVQIAKPALNSAIIPIIFIVSALVSGAALITFLYAFFGKQDKDKPNVIASLTNLLVLFIGIDLLLVAAEFLIGLYGGIPDDVHSLKEILTGSYGLVFWIGQIGLAVVIPILLIFLARKTDGDYRLQGLAGLSTVLGIIAVRINLVMPAYITPPLHGLDKAFVDSRLLYSYFPSTNEIFSSVGIIAFVILMFSVAWEWLPILERNNHPKQGRRSNDYGINPKGTTHKA